jgi:hypothetical protein
MSADRYSLTVRETFAAYRRDFFPDEPHVFDDRPADGTTPSVFRREHRWRNVLMPPDASDTQRRDILAAIATTEHHRWFASMASSQALCQSVFGSLKVMGQIEALVGIAAEDGLPAFFATANEASEPELEHTIRTLNEPRPTSIDAFFPGPHRVAVEVKFTEAEFGTCSRPRLTAKDPHFSRDACDGTLTRQRQRQHRCALTEQNIQYWRYVPSLFRWMDDRDSSPCPLARAYQLVRNLLAVSVEANGSVDTESAHVLVIYDDRNPAFHAGGKADIQWNQTVQALRYSTMLRRISWQHLVGYFAQHEPLHWLVDALRRKYGIIGLRAG